MDHFLVHAQHFGFFLKLRFFGRITRFIHLVLDAPLDLTDFSPSSARDIGGDFLRVFNGVFDFVRRTAE